MNKRSLLLASLGVAIIFFVYLFVQNLDKIYIWKANSEFKKNNIEVAQMYFEKAFEAGLKDIKQREIYLNTIINSPLNVSAQEKIMFLVTGESSDSVKTRAEFFVDNMKQEIHKKYTDNFIKQAVYNKKIVHWGYLPITYGFSQAEDVPEYFETEIESAFKTWEQVTDNQLKFQKTDINPNILITFNPINPAQDDGSKYIVAYTIPTIETGKLTHMDILFYLKEPNGNYFSKNQVYSTALHEIVHALGFMGHSNNKADVMYLTKDTMCVEKDLREILTQADVNTVKLLYKIKPDITNVEDQIEYEYIPFLVLGDETDVSNAKIKEAKTYIRNAPEMVAGYMDLAEAYVASKEYTKAIKCLERALLHAKSNDMRDMIYYNLAVTYYFIDIPDLAQNYLQKSMEIKVTDEKKYLLADLYAKQNLFDEAVATYEELIQKKSENIEYTIALTNLYVTKKKYLYARKVLKNYVEKNPEDKNNKRFESYGILKMGL